MLLIGLQRCQHGWHFLSHIQANRYLQHQRELDMSICFMVMSVPICHARTPHTLACTCGGWAWHWGCSKNETTAARKEVHMRQWQLPTGHLT
jgi:hypothetical protein